MSGFILSPIGIIVIAIYSFLIISIALLIGWLMSRFLKLRPCWRWVLLAPPVVVLLALPWAEEAWISWHFDQACKDAGVKVYRTVEVEGYLNAQNPKKKRSIEIGLYSVPNPVSFEQQGYRYYEEALVEGGVSHHERFDGQIEISILEHPTARYRLEHHYQPTPYRIEEPIGWKLEKIEYRVVDNKTDEILGRRTVINRVLPTYEALIAGLFGPPIISCPSLYISPSFPQPSLPFPQAILKPVSK